MWTLVKLNKVTVYSILGFYSDMSLSPKVSVGKNI